MKDAKEKRHESELISPHTTRPCHNHAKGHDKKTMGLGIVPQWRLEVRIARTSRQEDGSRRNQRPSHHNVEG